MQNLAMYEKLDQLIIKAIQNRKPHLYEKQVHKEAMKIVKLSGRDKFRVIDGRISALKKQGKIIFKKKQLNNGQEGWHVLQHS